MSSNNPKIIYGLTHTYHYYRMWLHMMMLAWKEYRSLPEFLRAVRSLLGMKKNFAGESNYCKGVLAQKRFYWHVHIPGYPSVNFDRHFRATINTFQPVSSPYNRLAVLYFGITRTCPINCRHCYDWDKLNTPDSLPVKELRRIVSGFQKEGLGQVLILGGEPMARFDDLVEIISGADPVTDFWISTSGYHFDEKRAEILKQSGLRGVSISLDHFEADRHNAFRGHPGAFDWAMHATECAVKAGLITSWSICVSNDFIKWDNLLAYSRFAGSKRVHFIQVFEPMPVGRYNGEEVNILPEKIAVLEKYFLAVNQDPQYKNLPVVVYPGYHQRRHGCLGAGKRILYADSEGNLHPCPFCRSSKELNFFQQPVSDLLDSLKLEGCRFY